MDNFFKRVFNRRGSRVSTINDWLHIKVGGQECMQNKKGRNKKKTNRVKSTKYTLITFLPQNLFEQFRRIANFYFLVMTIISVLIDSPVSPMTSLLPLVFVIAVTAAKQGYEDFLRYKTDNVVNCSLVTIINKGQEEHIQAQLVAPGDLIVVERDCDVPCDLVILRSTDPHGKCFITTANLDGETNLKTLVVPKGLPVIDLNALHKIGFIECENAKTDLYNFNGKIELTIGEKCILPLSAENVLLRGSRVKNTECVIGCAIYTGMNTKLQLNSRLTRNKSASSEIYINRFLIFILAGLIAIVTVLYFLKRYNEVFIIPKLSYLGPPADSYSVQQFLQDYLSFLILFNYLIPISLYVTIELHRVFGGFFMEWDLNLYDELTDEHCIVNTSNLNEELGQINILFSDKTGTLTKNEMNFQQCSINGKKYVYRKTKILEEDTKKMLDIDKFSTEQNNFFEALTICHTIQVSGEPIINGIGDKQTSNTKTQLITDNELPETSYPITNITEESHNSSQHSINSAVQTSEIALTTDVNLKMSTSDVNPLLYQDTKLERKARPIIVKRNPSILRPSSRVIPKTSFTLQTCPENETKMPGNRAKLSRHLSLQFKRSSSENELEQTNNNLENGLGHRRCHSYGASEYMSNADFEVRTNTVQRSASTVSRESYAAPIFQRNPTMLVRAESKRRKLEIEETVQSLNYQASSPDEKALVEACAHLGMVFLGDDDEILRIRKLSPHIGSTKRIKIAQERKYVRLHVLEFTSDRKRMSVIVNNKRGEKWMYTKGAESYVFPLCSNTSADMVTITNEHINMFAKHGLRTLAIARKKIPLAEYKSFLNDLNTANESLENRKQLLEECYAKIENELELLGATAVEDALQDEVSDTLISLQKAGIKIWVLTGDKVETALNIALACGHIPENAKKYFIVDCSSKDDMLLHFNSLNHEINANTDKPTALLLDGKSLSVALKDTPNEFRDVAIKCIAVLCCRLSPLQKSEVVSLIKSSSKNYVTASIGDGANDVSMIQEAHVGIGIMGKEGRQAARCADFAFAKFCLLKPLLLVHGHYHTSRLSLLVLYFFYKNVYFMGIMLLFQFYSLFSSSSVYDSLFLTL